MKQIIGITKSNTTSMKIMLLVSHGLHERVSQVFICMNLKNINLLPFYDFMNVVEFPKDMSAAFSQFSQFSKTFEIKSLRKIQFFTRWYFG